jgi:hypothetical protein
LSRWRSTNGIFRDDDDSYSYRIGSGEAMVQGAHSWRGLKKKERRWSGIDHIVSQSVRMKVGLSFDNKSGKFSGFVSHLFCEFRVIPESMPWEKED